MLHNLISVQGSPVPLLKFQMAPRRKLLMSYGSKKKELIYRVSQEECARLWEGVPYVKVYRYNTKHLCPKWNGYGDNGQRKAWSSCGSTHCTCRLTMLPVSALSVTRFQLDGGQWNSLHKKCAACTAYAVEFKAVLRTDGRLVVRCC